MRNFFKKYWDIIILISIFTILVIINIRPHSIIMGLDNASPYFNPNIILHRIKGTSTIIYGGILFQFPLLILSTLGVSASLLSNIYLFSNLIFGIVGVYSISSSLSKKKLPRIIAVLIFISSLLTTWIFAHPNFLFISAYGTIPILIYLLGKERKVILDYLLLAVFSILFLTTSLNLVAFFLYLIQIVILAKVLYPNSKIKELILWLISIIAFWVITLQTVKLINEDTSILFVNVFQYFKDLLNNQTVKSVSEGIIESEKTNSLIQTLSFSLGWTELHDASRKPVFQFYSLYRENLLYLCLGMIPTLTALYSVFKVKSKKVISLTALLIIFIFISSKYGMFVIERIPLISHGLRWSSSKTWPLFIIPIVSLNTILLKDIFNKGKREIKFVILLLLIIISLIYSFPILNGNLLSPKILVNIPKDYFELPGNSDILVLPEPQSLYMREYNWGYYGSDFLSYINSSRFIDQANLYETGVEYNDILELKKVPKYIDYIMYDNSIESNKDYSDFLEDFKIVKSNEYYKLYGR